MRILYVEDDETLQQELTLLLSDLFETIILASNGQEGLEAFKQDSFDLVITDIRMPVMDGIEMIGQIRQINPAQPIIVTSAHNEVEYLVKLIHLGVDNFITKPLSSDLIFETLSKSARHIYEAKELHRQKGELEDFRQNIEAQVAQKSIQLKSDYLKIKSYKESYDRISSTITLNSQGEIIECSQPVMKMLHVENDEIIGKTIREFFHSKFNIGEFLEVLNNLSESSIWQDEVVLVDTLMNTHICLLTITPICTDGECGKFMICVQDVTNWHDIIKERNYAIERSKENYSLARSIENIPLPAMVLNENGAILYSNSEVMELIEEGFDNGLMYRMLDGNLYLWDLVEFTDTDFKSPHIWSNKTITHCEAKYETILGVINIHVKIKRLPREDGVFLALFCYQGVGDDAF